MCVWAHLARKLSHIKCIWYNTLYRLFVPSTIGRVNQFTQLSQSADIFWCFICFTRFLVSFWSELFSSTAIVWQFDGSVLDLVQHKAKIFLCLEFCGPLSWNHAIASITAPLSLNLNMNIRFDENKNTNHQQQAKITYLFCSLIRGFFFSCCCCSSPSRIARLEDRMKEKNSFSSIANDALHIVWLFSRAASCFKKEYFKRGNCAIAFVEEERKAIHFSASTLLWYGMLFVFAYCSIFIKCVENHCSVNGIYLLWCLFIFLLFFLCFELNELHCGLERFFFLVSFLSNPNFIITLLFAINVFCMCGYLSSILQFISTYTL